MSFSSTPLGQGRRLDHSSFLGKPASTGQIAQPSYAYGAPALGSRSPPKPTSPRHTTDQEENDPALVRFARLKQRESVAEFNSRPGGPKIISSPPKPDRWSVKDTSVNIATAFTQAASSSSTTTSTITTAPDMNTTYNHPNNSWASTSKQSLAIPRSTSVEYEAATSKDITKRLAPPPDRLGRTTNTTTRKPLSKTTSLRHVPDSEGEDESASTPNARAKSPFDTVFETAKKVLGPAVYFVRERSREPDEPSMEQPSMNGHNTSTESYDYATEEQRFQAKRAHKRNRMSVDNKAYKPPSDDDYSDLSDDGKGRRRRRKGKKGPAGGPLTTLPTVGAEKKKKRRPRGPGGITGGPEESESESEDVTQDDLLSQSQLRTSNPPTSRASIPRISVDPPDLALDDSMEVAEQGLHSIPEIEEDFETPSLRVESHQRPRSRSRSRTPAPIRPTTSAAFSVGGLLGTAVRLTYKSIAQIVAAVTSLFAMLLYLTGHVFGTMFDIILRRPLTWLQGAPGPGAVMVKYLFLGLTVFTAWWALQDVNLGSYVPSIRFRHPSQKPIYTAPDVPAADIRELAERLLRIENALSGLSSATEQTKVRADDSLRGYSEVASKLSSLESRLMKETKKVSDTDAKERDAVMRSVHDVRSEVEILQSLVSTQQRQQQQQDRQRDQQKGASMDEEARAKLRLLEERVGGVEGDVKEAMDLGKKVSSAVAAIPSQTAAPSSSSAPNAAWWNKLASSVSSRSGLQIKSTDGQDVTALITHLVDDAVGRMNKDGIAKPDFALHSGGARVIPSLTSPTFERRPGSLSGQMWSLITGNGYGIGRPPITALHHEIHLGHCWPFAGTQGQLGVALAAPTFVQEVTIDHVAEEVAFDMQSAPKDMEVWGLVEGKDNIERVRLWRESRAARKEAGQSHSQGIDPDAYDDALVYPLSLPENPEFIRLANFTYDIHGRGNVQTFPVHQEVRELGIDFGIVALKMLSNWGTNEFTCLYRFRVHGRRMDPGEVGGGDVESS